MIDETRFGDEYRNARLRMQELAIGLTEDDGLRVVTACPAWTVKDLFSHVTGIAVALSAGDSPTGDTQAWVDAQVENRRQRSLASVVEEWAKAGPGFESMIDAAPKALWSLTYDTVVHEHDLFTAVGRVGDRSSSGVAIAAELGLKLVKGDLRTHGLPAFRAVVDGVEHHVGNGEPALTLRASAFETLRLLGSRRTLAELRAADFEGDFEGMRPGIVHMDLPEVSLGEGTL